jgi:glycosyltransferase involved in cell wall biosynthesis
MRVALDTSATLFDPGGTNRYIGALTDQRFRCPGIELLELNIASSWPWVRRLSRQDLIRVHDLCWIPIGVERAARRAGAQLLHGPAFRVPATTRLQTAVTIHDDTPWDDPPTASWWTRTSLRWHVGRASSTLGLALVSNYHVAKALLRVVPELKDRIRITPFGVDHETFKPRAPQDIADCLGRLRCGERYVLFVGTYGRRKNFRAMVEALERAGAEARGLTLVVVGRPPVPRPQTRLAVRYVGSVTDQDLACLYSGARFLFYAGIKEGFGFPVLEAMACGCPVLTSRSPVLEELASGAAAVGDPHDPQQLMALCVQLLDVPADRERLRRCGLQRAASFTWDAAITATAAAWRDAVG